jgi:arylsulfatase A-like enzyme
MIYNPKLFAEGQVYPGISRHVDLMPTVLDLLGLPPQPLNEGISLASPHDEQLAVMHTNYKDDLNAVRDGQWKYIVRNPDGKEELYDLSADPKEKKDVAAAHPDILKQYREVAAQMNGHRDEYYRRVIKEYPMREAPDAGAPVTVPDASTPAPQPAKASDAGR